MKRVSLIAAGLLAYGLTAARAQVGPTQAPPNPTPPSAGAPGGVGTTSPGTVEVDVTEEPTPQPAPVAAPPTQPSVMPPAKAIDANTAAIYGGVTESTVPVAPIPQPEYRQRTAHDTSHTWVGNLGAGVLVGGGFEDFTNSNLRSMTGGGGAWNARVLAGTRQFVGVEAAYVGAARGVDALGVQSNAVLVSNGVEGAVRLNVPVVLRSRQLLEPFGFVGLGWQRYQVTNTNTNTSSLANNDDIMSMPVGGGLEYAIGRFMADARFTYRSTYYNDLMRFGGNVNNWGVSTQVGVSF
jgi:hypothetical protein